MQVGLTDAGFVISKACILLFCEKGCKQFRTVSEWYNDASFSFKANPKHDSKT